jgi:hypothetical protein
MKRKRTADDVHELQCQVLEKELEKNDLVIEKTRLQIELLNGLKEERNGRGSYKDSVKELFSVLTN